MHYEKPWYFDSLWIFASVYYHYQPPTNNSFGDQPTIPDEVFVEYAEVKKSPGAGEGAFATKDIPKGAIVAQYGGYRLEHNSLYLPPELAQPPELGKGIQMKIENLINIYIHK